MIASGYIGSNIARHGVVVPVFIAESLDSCKRNLLRQSGTARREKLAIRMVFSSKNKTA